MKNCEYMEDTHTYYVDGKAVPSVTQLVAPLGEDFSEVEEMLGGRLDNATERGTLTHGYIAHRLMGGEIDDYELPHEYEPYVAAVELFLAEHHIAPGLIEEPLYADKFAGTPDLVCIFDGNLSILDYKFVSTISKSKVGAQLAGYLELCNENGIHPDLLYAVQFLPNGEYRLYPVAVHPSRISFGLCKAIYEAKCKKHPKGAIA